MSALGQKRTLEHVSLMSALPPKADISDTRLATAFCLNSRSTGISIERAAPSSMGQRPLPAVVAITSSGLGSSETAQKNRVRLRARP